MTRIALGIAERRDDVNEKVAKRIMEDLLCERTLQSLRARLRLRKPPGGSSSSTRCGKIGARDVVEQHPVLPCEQLSAPLRQMRLESSLVREQMIEAAIKAVLVDLLIAKLQQIAERRAAVPVLGNVQLAGRLAEPRRHQHGRHLRLGDAFLARRQLLKARSAPHRRTDASARCG